MDKLTDVGGRVIEVGDLVLIPQPIVPTYRVVDVVPDLAPGVPAGFVRVTLAAQIVIRVGTGQPAGNLVLVKAGERAAEAAGRETEGT